MAKETTLSGQLSKFISATTKTLGELAVHTKVDNHTNVIQSYFKIQQEYWYTIKAFTKYRSSHPDMDTILRTMYYVLEVLGVAIRKGTVIIPKKHLGELIQYMLVIHKDPTLDITLDNKKTRSLIKCRIVNVNDNLLGLSVKFTGLPIEFIYTKVNGRMHICCPDQFSISDEDLGKYGSIAHAYLTGIIPTKGVYLQTITEDIKILKIVTHTTEYHLVSNILTNTYQMSVVPKTLQSVSQKCDWRVVEFPRTDTVYLEMWESMVE